MIIEKTLDPAYLFPEKRPSEHPESLTNEEIDERLKVIRQRLESASLGPWHWTEDIVNEQYRNDARKHKRKGGRSRNDTFVYLLQSWSSYNVFAGRLDPWEKQVMVLSWNSIKGSSLFNGKPSDSNAKLIESAPTDLEFCLRLIDHLRGIESLVNERGDRSVLA